MLGHIMDKAEGAESVVDLAQERDNPSAFSLAA